MNLQTWRKQRTTGEEMQLPSGLAVKMKQISLMDMAILGDVPTPLTAQVNMVMERGLQNITVENARQYEEAINLVVKAAVIDPPIGDESTETTLAVRELPIIDRLAIFRECNRYAESLRPFRPKQKAPVEPA